MSISETLPDDTNLQYAPENNDVGHLYFADPQPSENGLNRVVRVNYETMSYTEANDSIVLANNEYLLDGQTDSNPHSVDRAGRTNKFYVRTQNCSSFDVIAAEGGKLVYKKTVPLTAYIDGERFVPYSPRAFGAYNDKYGIQLMSGRNSPGYTIVGIVDVSTDVVLRNVYAPLKVEGTTSVSGHAEWLDTENFAIIDRGNKVISIYQVFINSIGDIDVRRKGTVATGGPTHSLERVQDSDAYPEDIATFYSLGEAVDIIGNIHDPFVAKLTFDVDSGSLFIPNSVEVGSELPTPEVATFYDTDHAGLELLNVSASTHHTNITADRKHLIVPVYDGKVYKINRKTMNIDAVINTGLVRGLGAAHVEFSEKYGLAIVTNHWSPYISIIDISYGRFELKAFVKIYKDDVHDVHDPDNKHLMQPHFAHMSDDGRYYYTFASQDNGRFVRVDLVNVLTTAVSGLKILQFDNNSDDSNIIKAIYVGGAPEQAHS